MEAAPFSFDRRPPTATVRRRAWGALAALAAMIGLGQCAATAVAASDDAAAPAEDFKSELAELAAWCDGKNLTDEAVLVRRWLPPDDPARLFLLPAPEPTMPTAAADAAPQQREWRERFTKLRRQQAARHFAAAGEAAQAGRARRAYELLRWTVREDPDHADARRLLGHVQRDGQWTTAFAARMAAQGKVWHDRYGWLPAGHVPRYEAGERFYNGRWVTAEAEARLRGEADGWTIPTEHYVVRTNDSLEAGVRLAVRLERLYDVWQQVFIGYRLSGEQAARLFAGKSPPPAPPRRHKVVFFRNRDDYNQALAKIEPNIGISTGFYFGDRQEAYFFASDENDDTNLYHEATHQLFSESRPVPREIARDANFWIVEGIACYMESLAERDGWTTLGGADATRLGDARFRAIDDGFYVPLDQLVGYGMTALQRDPQIAKLYSQSAGLSHFLMHARDAEYRDALVDYLTAVYAGRAQPATLAALTGSDFATLDGQYREFLEKVESAAKLSRTVGHRGP